MSTLALTEGMVAAQQSSVRNGREKKMQKSTRKPLVMKRGQSCRRGHCERALFLTSGSRHDPRAPPAHSRSRAARLPPPPSLPPSLPRRDSPKGRPGRPRVPAHPLTPRPPPPRRPHPSPSTAELQRASLPEAEAGKGEAGGSPRRRAGAGAGARPGRGSRNSASQPRPRSGGASRPRAPRPPGPPDRAGSPEPPEPPRPPPPPAGRARRVSPPRLSRRTPARPRLPRAEQVSQRLGANLRGTQSLRTRSGEVPDTLNSASLTASPAGRACAAAVARRRLGGALSEASPLGF
ncbi:unnamed protein product [Nyctereutes procyonoides]|uniref:(raccoon dog) hypothetical protein n=1 Tax=Nyctereutes procyonoides TaxID=34880 RepID=A0A811YUF7_NYCPR|nr:unnamed protein product [Nyctereutes procyonoides]